MWYFIDNILLLCYFSFDDETNALPHTYAYILRKLSGFVSVDAEAVPTGRLFYYQADSI